MLHTPSRRERAFATFKATYGSHMSTTKWLKLICLLNDVLPEEYRQLIYYTAWDGYDGDKVQVHRGWSSLLSPNDIVDGATEKYIRDGALGCPFPLRELWELAIPVRAREETLYPTGKSHVVEKELFCGYPEFLQAVDQVASFPCEITKTYTKNPSRKQRSTIKTWQFIVFYGYDRDESLLR